jgi:hypothetical protein
LRSVTGGGLEKIKIRILLVGIHLINEILLEIERKK